MQEEKSSEDSKPFSLSQKIRLFAWGAFAALAFVGFFRIASRGTIAKLFLLQDAKEARVLDSTSVPRELPNSKNGPLFPDQDSSIDSNVETVLPLESPPTEATDFKLEMLYYISISSDGRIQLQPKSQTVPITTNPAKTVVETLLWEPAKHEGVTSLIAEGTKLNSLKTENSLTTVDLSEEFLFNPLGGEGIAAELAQIVYTLTEFSEIERVQFLIDGQVIDYMSPGIYTKEPLERESFSF